MKKHKRLKKLWRIIDVFRAPEYIREKRKQRSTTRKVTSLVSPLPSYTLTERIGYIKSRSATLWSLTAPMREFVAASTRDNLRWLKNLITGRVRPGKKPIYRLTPKQWRNLRNTVLGVVAAWLVATAFLILNWKTSGMGFAAALIFWLGLTVHVAWKVSLLTRIKIKDVEKTQRKITKG